MHRLAEALNNHGREATIIQDDAKFHPGWFESNVNTISLAEFRKSISLRSDRDVVIIPETFVAVLPKYAPGIPKIVFNQNGAYSFGLDGSTGFPCPEEVLKLYKHPDLKHVLCISQHDELLLKRGFKLGDQKVSRLINGIETTLFKPTVPKQRIISYMPRKNAQDSAVVAALLKQKAWFRERGWILNPIKGLPQEQVANVLQRSLIFLSFGHPEGFGLPLAEAAGCGCYLIGYSGLGGRELLQIAQNNSAGVEIAYGDWLGFVQACSEVNDCLNSNQSELVRSLSLNSKFIRNMYSTKAMIGSVQQALNLWEPQLS